MADIIAQGIGSAFDKIEIVSNKGYKFERNGIPNIEKLQNSFMLKKVQSKGKHIAMYLDSDEEIVVINTLNMTGTWAWNQTNHKHARINFCGRNNLTFLDQRNFGSFKIVSPKEAKKRLDLLGEDFTKFGVASEKWGNAQLEKKYQNLEIGIVLMKDTLCCGIGNIYKAEILWFMGIHPQKLVKDIHYATWEAIPQVVHSWVLYPAYKRGGSSIYNFRANGEMGTNQDFLWVYNKKQCPYGHKTSIIKQKGRTTWFCPKCQI